MLDSQLIDQLRTVFANLDGKVELRYDECHHEQQKQLLDMLNSVAETSAKIFAVPSGHRSELPSFRIAVEGLDCGVAFWGIPDGHEFTSLVIAILNADGKGKYPDDLMLNRIKALKGPIDLQTYISLTCENCPEVVQALNLMAIVHPEFKHTMIDGGLAQKDIERLGIQGVPSVVGEGDLISVGKVSLIDLINKLEAKYGSEPSKEPSQVDLGDYDVAVLGAGPAGASAAIYAVRKGLRTIVIGEKLGGQVQDTKGIENLISVPYVEGPHLSAQLANHMAAYDIKPLEHRRIKSVTVDSLHSIELETGEHLRSKAIIVATGAKWRELGIPGEKEYLGRGVAFCPHCDGPYYKGKEIAVIGGGNSGVEAAIDLAGIVKSVVVFEFMPELKADKVLVEKLNSLPNVSVMTNVRTSEVIGNGERMTGIEYQDRTTEEMKKIDLDGVFVQIGLIPNSGFVKDIVETNKFGEILIDEKCRTNIRRIYAAGDVTTVPFKQIVIAMGEGAKAALTAFEDLTF
jgi:alkyl hydroperoxide reductase subunit F